MHEVAGANPTLYATLVLVHILAGLAALGMNFTYGVWISRAAADRSTLPFALRTVKFIDDVMANPCYLLAGATGVAMILLGKDVKPFLQLAIGLYVAVMIVAYAVYTPLLSRQIRTLDEKGADSPEYRRLAGLSGGVGAGMGFVALVIVALKIYEPALW